MLIGLGQNGTNAGSPSSNDAPIDYIFDAGVDDFEEKVIKPSMERPVLVDFWAPWCGPCKTLMPVLEEEVKKVGGAVLLAKVNLDENQQLAAMMRVQSVPTVYAFFKGQPITGFQGGQPAPQIAEFIANVMETAGVEAPVEELDLTELIEAAGTAKKAGDHATALRHYESILQLDPENTDAHLNRLRLTFSVGDMPSATTQFENAPELLKQDRAFASLQNLPTLLSQDTRPLGDLQSNEDQAVVIERAIAQLQAGAVEGALETLLSSIAADREFNDSQARKTLLQILDILGTDNTLAMNSRKKLSIMLFS